MTEYEVTIGLEIHAELKTRTKMFCTSANDPFASAPNLHVCPTCLAHPGTLPVINKEAVHHVLRLGAALGSNLADYTEFDRKNYFYPDLPKGYQLSQYKYPLVAGGNLNGVPITRVHLEEDTASSVHFEETGETLIDYNRAGVPLMELVTEPEIKSSRDAGNFARELQILLRYLGISDANMEKGEMRVEANVSVSPTGTRSSKYVEIKNLNSFNAMERAVEYEIKRQTELLKNGGLLEKQTLGWDETRQMTFPQRTKEGAADYRYFPDPDLPSLMLSDVPEFNQELLRRTLPELPSERRARYASFDIKSEDIELYIIDDSLRQILDGVIAVNSDDKDAIKLISNYLVNDVRGIIREIHGRDTTLGLIESYSPQRLSDLVDMIRDSELSSAGAKKILVEFSVDPLASTRSTAERLGVIQATDRDFLRSIVREVMSLNEKSVEDYTNGKEQALKYLVGQAMRLSKGSANPLSLEGLLREEMLRK